MGFVVHICFIKNKVRDVPKRGSHTDPLRNPKIKATQYFLLRPTETTTTEAIQSKPQEPIVDQMPECNS